MAQFTSPTAAYREDVTREVANPMPLGLIILALTTAMLGAGFAHFLMPTTLVGVGTIVVPVLIYGGVIQILAGMWAFRKNRPLSATLFSAYGGFLIIVGALFLPALGMLPSFAANTVAFNHALGLLFLCWAISCAILLLAALRTNMALILLLASLALAYLFLAIGEFANANRPLLIIGGWLAILGALIAWYTALASILHSTGSQFQLPTGEVEGPPAAPTHRYGSEPTM